MAKNATPVAMDMKKLWQCQQFFIKHLLPARQATYSVREYQTNMKKFEQYYDLVRDQTNLAEHFQITGTLPIRRAVKRFAVVATIDEPTVPNMPRNDNIPEGSTIPAVDEKAWPASVKKALLQEREEVEAEAEAEESGEESGEEFGEEGEEEGGGAESPQVKEVKFEWNARGTTKVKFLVHFLPSAADISFGKTPAVELIQYMRENGYQWLFLVTVSGLTTYATRELQASCAFETWPMKTCLSRLNTHFTVPPHRRLSPKEKKDFFAKWRVSQAQVSRMYVTEKIAKFYGYVPGDVIEIQRRTFVGCVLAYRVVTHAPQQ